MLGFLFRLVLMAIVVGAVWALFEFRFVNNELRVRSRFSEPGPSKPRLAKPAQENHPPESQRQIQRLIQEENRK